MRILLSRPPSCLVLALLAGACHASSPAPSPTPAQVASTPTGARGEIPIAPAAPSAGAALAPGPSTLDPETPAPTEARVAAIGSGGRVLLSVKAFRMRPLARSVAVALGRSPGDMDKPIATAFEYLAVLDPRTMCLDEAHVFDALDRARDPNDETLGDGTVAAHLGQGPATRDLARLRAVATTFGTPTVLGIAIGAAEGAYVTGDPTFVYASRDNRFKEPGWGASHSPLASPDGRNVVVSACGSPCGGMYSVHVLDMSTLKVRRTGSGQVHEGMRWSPDGSTLFFAFDDTTNGMAKPKKLCAAALDGKTWHRTTLACFSGEPGYFAVSPGAKAFAMTADNAKGQKDVVVFQIASAADGSPKATELYRVPGSPIYPIVDDSAAVMWTDNDGPDFHFRVHVAQGGSVRQIDDAEAVGFLPEGAILFLPNDRPSPSGPQIRTVRDVGRCGFFRVARSP
jgi:hypothetical protein